MSRIPTDRVEGLVKDKIAQAFERFGARVVVMPFILNGRLRKIVLQKRVEQRFDVNCISGTGQGLVVSTSYRLVGDGPMGMASDLLAENFVFDKIEAGRLVGVASTATFFLHLLPGATLADKLVTGEGETEDVVVSTLLDGALGLGALAKTTAKGGKAALVFARGAAATEAVAGVVQGREAITLVKDGKTIEGAAKAGEAVMRLFGAKALWKRAKVRAGSIDDFLRAGGRKIKTVNGHTLVRSKAGRLWLCSVCVDVTPLSGKLNAPNAIDAKLRRVYSQLWRPEDKNPAGTIGELLREVHSGATFFPHLIKAKARLRELLKRLNQRPPLSKLDRAGVERVINDLKDAIRQAEGR